MLARIVDEDPALRLQRADITHELLLLGSGEKHVGIAVEAGLGTPADAGELARARSRTNWCGHSSRLMVAWRRLA